MTLVLALFLAIVAVGLAVSSATFLQAHQKKADTSFLLYGQSGQFARSGITETVNWFRRQTAQPVMAFAPVLDTVATPKISDTDDPDIGLVREFQIKGSLWGRYEVWKQWDSDPDADRLIWRQQMQARDISPQRSKVSVGTAWQVKCVGYVFKKVDPLISFDQFPNQILGTEILETEVHRVTLTLPGISALNVRDGNDAHVNTEGRIIGGSAGAGISYPAGSGTPTTGPVADNRVTGISGLSPSPAYQDSPEYVFGVSEDNLRSMADFVITDMANFPVPVPAGAVVFVDLGNAQFDAATPLNGTGIVYVAGSVHIANGSNSSFSGLLYCKGGLTMRAPSEIRGTVISLGNVTIQGSGDFATIRYDGGVIDALRLGFDQYRRARAIRRAIVRD